LAQELTTLVHGKAETEAVEAASDALFRQGDLSALEARALAGALAELPAMTVERGSEPPLVDLLIKVGLYSSRGEVRRAVTSGGVYLNNERIADADAPAPEQAWLHGRFLVLRKGKRSLAAVTRS
jgi:tyrosyl-tRNA synthetase